VGHRFPEGHQRFGGRKKRTAQQARALADEMGVDPLEFMLSIIKSEVMDQTVIENGKQKKVKAVVPLDVRLDAAKTVINYMYPRLNSTAVTGADDGPIALATLDLTPILANPELARAAQEIAMQLMEAEAAQIEAEPGHQPKLLEAEYTD
jgi:hypothetical protein